MAKASCLIAAHRRSDRGGSANRIVVEPCAEFVLLVSAAPVGCPMQRTLAARESAVVSRAPRGTGVAIRVAMLSSRFVWLALASACSNPAQTARPDGAAPTADAPVVVDAPADGG